MKVCRTELVGKGLFAASAKIQDSLATQHVTQSLTRCCRVPVNLECRIRGLEAMGHYFLDMFVIDVCAMDMSAMDVYMYYI